MSGLPKPGISQAAQGSAKTIHSGFILFTSLENHSRAGHKGQVHRRIRIVRQLQTHSRDTFGIRWLVHQQPPTIMASRRARYCLAATIR